MIIVVGTGKLAKELLGALPAASSLPVVPWAEAASVGAGGEGTAVVVHAGSGRELDDVIRYCRETGAILVELATGSVIEKGEPGFPVVVCPNTNLLMLKFLAMLAASGALFRDYTVRLSESHQAGKSSVPGTAVAMAASLGLPSGQIRSIRNPQEQREVLNIPPEYLDRHAYHRIEIEDQAGSSIVLETRVASPAPYAAGLAQIIAALRCHTLEKRRYSVMELIGNGWL